MKKIIILTSLACILLALYFVPVTLQKTTTVKASFFNVYNQLTQPNQWKRWRPDLRKILLTDSNKIAVKKATNAFIISQAAQQLNVKVAGTLISVDEKNNDNTTGYAYFVVPDNPADKTLVTVYKDANLLTYLADKFKAISFADTYVDDLKHYMETDSLFYGFNILKTKVPADKLAVVVKTILAKNELTEANKALAELRQFIKANKINQTAPLINQFIVKNDDSVQMKVGIFIDREITPYKDITFERMPKGGNLRTAKFTGRYSDRKKVYESMQKYFNDHSLQQGILPFEEHPDNKLPVNDTDKVSMLVNFVTLF